MVRSSGAIGALILCTGLAFPACAPNLDRSAGSLELLWYGVDGTADQLRATVTQREQGYQLEADPNLAARLSVESVPSGPVTVLGEAIRQGVVLQSRIVVGEINPDSLTTLALDLGNVGLDGGVASHLETGWILAPLHFVGGAPQTSFVVGGPFEAALGSTLTNAERQLGVIQSITVTGARITLMASGETDLTKVWKDQISIGLRAQGSGSVGSVVATGTPIEDTSVFEPPLTGSSLASILPDLLAGRVEAAVEGAADSGGEAPTVDAQVSMRFRIE